MRLVFNTLDAAGTNYGMHAVIAVTAWSANTTVYYDHWEDGYDFDPANPATADETVILANTGDQRVFESANIPTNPRGTATYYDGGDRIYVAGGTVTVTRASWIEARGSRQPGGGVGDLPRQAAAHHLRPPLRREPRASTTSAGCYVLIQATADNTTFTVDLNGDGTADPLDQNRDGDKTDAGDTATVTLQRGPDVPPRPGERVPSRRAVPTPGTLDDAAPSSRAARRSRSSSSPANPGQNYCARGLSAFPRGFWTKDYYAPLDQPTRRRRRHRLLPLQPARRGDHRHLGDAHGERAPSRSPPTPRCPSGPRRRRRPHRLGPLLQGQRRLLGRGVGDRRGTPTSGATASCPRRSSTRSTSSAGRRLASRSTRRRPGNQDNAASSSPSPRTTPASSSTSTTTARGPDRRRPRRHARTASYLDR